MKRQHFLPLLLIILIGALAGVVVDSPAQGKIVNADLAGDVVGPPALGDVVDPPNIETAFGSIIKINNARQHGTIERTDNGSADWYQFRIPEDVVPGYDPQVNQLVNFTPVIDTAKRATLVSLAGDNP